MLNKNKKNPSRGDFPKAVDLLTASLAIALLLMTAGVAKAVYPIDNWPDLKALLHSQADSKAVTLSRGDNLVLNASNAVLAPDLSLLQVDPVNDPTVVVPANGVLTFAVDVTEPMYVGGAVSIAADLADLRPGLRAYVLSNTTVVGAPMIYQEAPPGGQIDFDLPGEMPDNIAPLRTWRLDPGRHYISIAGPHYRAAGTFESLELQGLPGVPKTPTYTFAQISDTHIDGPWVATTLLGDTFDALRQEGTSFAIVTGDMTNTGVDFTSFASTITAGGGLPVYGVIGNHDAFISGSRDLAMAIPGLFPTGDTNYVLNKPPLRFIVVDGAYWERANGEYVDYQPSDWVGRGMGPDGLQWFTDTLAADTTTPTVVVSHFPFLFGPGETQCGYILSAQEGELQDIIKAAPNVIATLNGHAHWNHLKTYQNDYGDDITSLQSSAFVNGPRGYKVFRVYLDGDDVRLEWEMRLVDNMGWVAVGASSSSSWRISTSYELDLVSEPVGMMLPGDVDLDGFVGETDLSTITTYWGQSLGREFGDLNGNGIVDGPDYTEVLSYWNPAPLEPAPEPATLALLLVGGLALLRRKA